MTAIYEFTPVGGKTLIGESRYQQPPEAAAPTDESAIAQEYAFLKFRYKLPGSSTSQLITTAITPADEISSEQADPRQWQETQWATAVAAFGQILKSGKYTGDFSYDDVIELARLSKGEDEFGYRAEFINLARLARTASPLPGN